MSSEEAKLPELFDGATHRVAETMEPVKITQWLKDGDHPLVERYPIERRTFKGLLVVDEKTKFALHYGEWIIEDAEGRIYVESSPSVFESKYVPVEEGGQTP